jgi:hypothetical protein
MEEAVQYRTTQLLFVGKNNATRTTMGVNFLSYLLHIHLNKNSKKLAPISIKRWVQVKGIVEVGHLGILTVSK